jgi:glycosyltransferase involved in cell wall biosynthesis
MIQSPITPTSLRVAIVHDWLKTYSGAEKVLEQLLIIWPEADLFAVVDFVPEGERAFLQGKKPITTFIQKMPWAGNKFRGYLPFMPLAIEQLDMSAYNVVISSNHAVAKGVLTGPNQMHVSYVHSPMRYAWDMQHQYLAESGMVSGVKSWIVRAMLHYMRLWDYRSANGVDEFLANSSFIAGRIRKSYRRKAVVLYPPVDVERFALRTDKEDFYLSACRMVPYKRVPLVVEAFRKMPAKRLVLVGDGPDLARIRADCPANVEIKGFLPTSELVDLMQRAKAMVFAAEEDFGIAPVEAQACGTPIIAYGRGGSLETVQGDHDKGDVTGLFFYEQTEGAICKAVAQFEASHNTITPQACRAHAEKFSILAFRQGMSSFINDRWAKFKGAKHEFQIWE